MIVDIGGGPQRSPSFPFGRASPIHPHRRDELDAAIINYKTRANT
jgi:hypothetical protein